MTCASFRRIIFRSNQAVAAIDTLHESIQDRFRCD